MATGRGLALALLFALAVALVLSPARPPQAHAEESTLVLRPELSKEGFQPVFTASAPSPQAMPAAQPEARPEAQPTPEAPGERRSRLGLVLIAVGAGVALAGVLILLILGGWRQRSG